MKRLLCVLLLAPLSCAAFADDSVAAKMLSLFSRFDADRNGTLSPEEQRAALAAVHKDYGDKWAERIRPMFASAALPNGGVQSASWKKQVAEYGRELGKQTFRVAMRDGLRLATDVYLPRGAGRFPTVLTRTPYGRASRKDGAEGFTRSGMVFVAQDMRGRFDSEGDNIPFIGCGWNEHQDGVDTIAWIRKQPWSNGGVATIGGSAGGITQNLLAGAAPEGLTAQYITVAAASLYSDAAYIGGAFRKADVENWTTQNRFDLRALGLMRAHPTYDDYWRQFDTAPKFAAMNVPAVHQGGWFDMFAQATIDEFVGRQHQGANGSRGAQKLVMGPWTHGLGRMPVGELRFPNSKVPGQYDAGRWFGHYLNGENNGVEKEPAVMYYVMGDTHAPGAPGNQWRHADDWPIPATETAFYFAGDHKLTAAKPTEEDDAHVQFTFDPANPCPTIGGNNLTIARGPMNQNCIEARDDVVLFTTEPLAAPLEVTGRVKAHLFVSSSAPDTDLSVRLCDVYPDGKSYLIAEGMLRLRYRKSFESAAPLTPGKVEEVAVDCWSTSIIFNKGHRIRAAVTSSNYPRFDVNPGIGQPWSDDGAKVKQTNRIYCGGRQASCLLLPVAKAQ